MQYVPYRSTLTLLIAAAFFAPARPAGGQAVVAAWGNVAGLRVDGEVFPFEISLCAVNDAGDVIARTAKERQQPKYTRTGSVRTIATRLRGLSIVETVEDTKPGEATIDVQVTADSATQARAFLCVDAPRSSYAAVRVIDEQNADMAQQRNGSFQFEQRIGRGIALESPSSDARRVEISVASPMRTLIGRDHRDDTDIHRILIAIGDAKLEIGSSTRVTFSLRASGKVDHSPVRLAIDASKPGRVFDGVGGNFRIQNPRVDPKVIAYNLANLRLAWARVEMPWRTWQSDTLVDPALQDTSQLDPKVRAAMEMARTAAATGAPVIVSAWFPPQWAVVGTLPRGGRAPDGTWGSQLDPARMEKIYGSLTSYLLYMKRYYGVEAAMFSFNESDLGIDVRQTPQEHADLIKGLGAYLKATGLKTKMLLGDVSDATPTGFIDVAMKDRDARPYIGAVSYHSWRGWSDSLLTFWSDAAKRLNVPLLVAEGSTDAGAYRYPAIFQEPDFALMEIELYVRMLALSEPKSILQWQLTSDYSLLAGGGVYGDTTALRPTQRFWNLKQLASTPERVAYLPMRCDGKVRCAALGNAREGTFAAHIVNTGASRSALVTGIPAGVKWLRVWTTNAHESMHERVRLAVRGGNALVLLDAASYVTVVGVP